jgi:UDP-N-acetyl-D-glucosamine dehydrogenase
LEVELESRENQQPIASAHPATVEAWRDLVTIRAARVGIIGLGYVGLPLALLFSKERFRVTGFDIDPKKVESLNRGESYIYSIGQGEIEAGRANGFRATHDYREIANVDAVLICVPTPLREGHTPDISFIVRTMEAIAPHLKAGQLVVLESTTYPGTTEEIVAKTIDEYGAARGVSVLRNQADGNQDSPSCDCLDGVLVAFSPEREDPGNTSVRRRDIPKVVGGVDQRATEVAEALYATVFERTVAMSTPAAAEMTKLLENIYRCVNIALVNEMKQLCQHMGIDIWEVIEAAATKPFGFQPFYPGPGVGGHCIPVDPFYLSWKSKQHGFATRFIELAGEVNESMPGYVVAAVERALEGQGVGAREQGVGRANTLQGSSVLVLGVAYKRDVDDLRESPALVIIDMLRQAGANVAYNDPYFPFVGKGRRYDLNMHSTSLEELARFDCVLIVTDHTSYDYARIVAESRLVVDSRNATRAIASAKIVRC